MERLLVEKSFKPQGQIGPFYIHEAVFLLLIFFALSIICYWISLSLGWYTTTPCLFVTGLILAQVLKKERINRANRENLHRIMNDNQSGAVLIKLAGRFHDMPTITGHLWIVKKDSLGGLSFLAPYI